VDKIKLEVKKLLLDFLRHNQNVSQYVIDDYVNKIDALYVPIGFKPKESTFGPDCKDKKNEKRN